MLRVVQVYWQAWVAIVGILLSYCVYAALPSAVEGQALPSLAPMLKKVTPAVVNISTSRLVRERDNPLLSDPLLRYFFNLPRSQPEQQQNNSLGSGVVIDSEQGYVVTNHHVIDKADTITVTLRDGRNLEARLIGSDPDTDVALLQVNADNLTALPQADSEKLLVGDFVVAIGNPFGLGQTVTSGIVSALGRSGLGIEGYEDFIQTDASINPGNSGGALVNLRGELVGINTAILAPGGSGGNVGIGFAIPMNMVQSIVDHLRDYGEVRRGMLGVSAQDISPDLAAAFGLAKGQGAVVVEMDKEATAAKAGVLIGDVIIAVNGQQVRNASDVRNRVGLLRVGDEATLEIIRDGKPLSIKAVIADLPGVNGANVSPYFDGARLREIEIDTRRGKQRHVMVQSVRDGSIAEQNALQINDVILTVNRISVDNLNDLKQVMNSSMGRMYLRLYRDASLITLRLR